MDRKVGIRLSEKQKDRLRQAMKDINDARSFRAMKGVLLRGEGHSAKWVAKNLGVSPKQVFVWCKSYREKGIGGLILRKPPGMTPERGDRARAVIPELLRRDPQQFGYIKGRWVIRDIAKELRREGISISFQSVGRILHDMGIKLRRPKSKSPGSLG